MFPHIPLPAVRFELERTGSVETTVERILRDGRLPEVRVVIQSAGPFAGLGAASECVLLIHRVCGTLQPPAGFFVDPSAPAPPAPVAPTPAAAPTKPTTPASLITRLGLQSRAAAASPDAPVVDNTEGKGKGKVGWETNPEARERNLKERKERMVLEARR